MGMRMMNSLKIYNFPFEGFQLYLQGLPAHNTLKAAKVEDIRHCSHHLGNRKNYKTVVIDEAMLTLMMMMMMLMMKAMTMAMLMMMMTIAMTRLATMLLPGCVIMIMIILDNVYDDKKAHQVVRGENHSTSIALHPKYSAQITIILPNILHRSQ